MDTLMEKQEKLTRKLLNVQAQKLLNNEKYVIMQEKMHLFREKLTQMEKKMCSEQSLCNDLLKKNIHYHHQKMMAEMTGISENVKFHAKLKLMKEYQKQFEDWSEKMRTQQLLMLVTISITAQEPPGEVNTVKQTAISQRMELESINQMELMTKKVELEQEIVNKVGEREQLVNLISEVETACNILKKRNNAVLKLKRKNLQDSEVKRRDIMRKLKFRKENTPTSVCQEDNNFHKQYNF